MYRFDGSVNRFDGSVNRFDGSVNRFDGSVSNFAQSVDVTVGADWILRGTLGAVSAQATTTAASKIRRFDGSDSNYDACK